MRVKLLIALILLLLVGVGADFAAARYFEGRAASVLAERYHLERPIVQVRDFPFLPRLALGRFSAIDLAASDARAKGVTAERVEVHLRDVSVPREVLLGEPGAITVGRADGQVQLSEAEVNRLLRNNLRGGTVRLSKDGVRLDVATDVAGQAVRASISGGMSARNGRIVFTPTRVESTGVPLPPGLEAQLVSLFRLDVPVPRLPADVQVERVAAAPEALIVSGRAGAVRVAT
jgi:LmeA-like phospholipid-binding